MINPLREQSLLCVADLHLSMLEAFCNLHCFVVFFYHRSASPNNGFMILNRLGLNNQIEPITKDLEFQLQDPFLLYRNSKGQWLEPHIASADSFYEKVLCLFQAFIILTTMQVIQPWLVHGQFDWFLEFFFLQITCTNLKCHWYQIFLRMRCWHMMPCRQWIVWFWSFFYQNDGYENRNHPLIMFMKGP